ncbi:MAG: InlB B-repeat-containing protein [Thermoleophilia bacterium]
MKRGLLAAVLAVLLLVAVGTPALAGTAPYTGVALYAGNATLTDSSKVVSPVVAGQPSATTYVNGILKTSRSASLSNTTLVVKSQGQPVPPLGGFMPDTLVSSLILASQAAQETGTTYLGLSYTKGQGASFTTPIHLNGDLTISGSGTYSFDSVYVSGNVAISGSPTISFASLRVGGKLTVSGGTSGHWGPTYVAGDVSLSNSGNRPIGLLVTAGNFRLGGTGTVGGDGIDSRAQPAQVLLVGENKQATITDSSIFYGLLYNRSGGLTQTRTSTIRGAVLLGGDYSGAGSCSVQYDGDLLEKLIHSALSFTVGFDSNGGSEIEPMQVNSGEALSALPVPNKADSIFLGWYTDNDSFEQAVTKDTPVISDLTLYARYAEIGGVQEEDLDTTVSAMDREPNFAIQVASSQTDMSAEAVKAALQLEVVNDTPFAGLSVSGSGGAYTVTATDGYTPGSSYKLTLTDPALTFVDEPEVSESVRTYCFTIQKQTIANVELASGIIQIPAGDIDNMIVNGAEALSLSLPLATTEGGLRDPGAGGTFTYAGSETLAAGDLLAIYEGTPPDRRDPTEDYSDQPVAYVEVTAIAGGTVTYTTPEAKEVLFTPDVLPVKTADDTDGDPDNLSITIAVSKMTPYTDPEWADLGLGPDTVVEEGDFLALGTGSTEENAVVTFAKITKVVVSGDNYIIAYTPATADELAAAMDLYSSHDADYGEVLEQIDVAATEAAIEQQAIDSGFAQAAAEYLTVLAQATDGFKDQLDKEALVTAAATGSGPVITNLEVDATINTSLEHFPGLQGLDCGVTVSFDVEITEDLNWSCPASVDS